MQFSCDIIDHWEKFQTSKLQRNKLIGVIHITTTVPCTHRTEKDDNMMVHSHYVYEQCAGKHIIEEVKLL